MNRYTGGYAFINNVMQMDYQYSESFNYDKMGNITYLERFSGDDVMDQLYLQYTGNQLKNVTDYGIQQSIYGLKDYQNKSNTQDEFAYDANGNMTKDLDRDIYTIRYNLLNLPDTIQFKNGHQIINKYDASGKKLKSEFYSLYSPTVIPVGTIGNPGNPNDCMVVTLSGTQYVGNIEYSFSNDCGDYQFDLDKVYNTEGYVNNIYVGSTYKYNYFRKDHLGNNREVWLANTGATIQRTQYYPSGLPWAEGTGAGVQNKKYNGKEWIEMHGLDEYDYGARGMYPAIGGRFMSVDPLAEKYYSISPYAYCAGNPIRYIDPDGRVVRLANNYAGGMENIAKIAATSLGSQVMSHLIGQRSVYTLNSTFWSSSSSYNPSNGDINYVGNPWYSEIPYDGGALTSMVAMGHEIFHAFDNSIGVFNSSNAGYSKDIAEPRAVSFGNYLRSAYSLSPLREQYGNIKGNFHQFGGNEKISDFTTLGNNSDKTSYVFSYTKTTTIVESYKKGFLGIKVPDKTRTETTTHYMTVSRDNNNNASFQIYNNEEEYKKATSNW